MYFSNSLSFKIQNMKLQISEIMNNLIKLHSCFETHIDIADTRQRLDYCSASYQNGRHPRRGKKGQP